MSVETTINEETIISRLYPKLVYNYTVDNTTLFKNLMPTDEKQMVLWLDLSKRFVWFPYFSLGMYLTMLIAARTTMRRRPYYSLKIMYILWNTGMFRVLGFIHKRRLLLYSSNECIQTNHSLYIYTHTTK